MIVAAGLSAALQLFEPAPAEQEICPYIHALSTLRSFSIQDVVEFLESKQTEIRLYTNAMIQD